MPKLLQLCFMMVGWVALIALTGLIVGAWVSGPATGSWLQSLWPRIIPIAVLSALGGMGLSIFGLLYYPELRNNSADKGFGLELLEGYVVTYILFFILNQVFNGWPGEITMYMGVMVTVSAGVGVGVLLVFLFTLLAEILYNWGFYSRR